MFHIENRPHREFARGLTHKCHAGRRTGIGRQRQYRPILRRKGARRAR